MSTTEMFVSLGHNASAAIAVDGVLVAAYEQERLDRKKASSAYPREAIDLCLDRCHLSGVDIAYVSHWFDGFELTASKYLDPGHLEGLAVKVTGLNQNLTHHDAHARSAVMFARSHGEKRDSIVVVMDGFGNRQECLSVYAVGASTGPYPCLLHRAYGYERSLGLMYQYATSYLGMKENQDEYKLLGYEAEILRHYEMDRVNTLSEQLDIQGARFADAMMDTTTPQQPGHQLIDFQALDSAKRYWYHVCADWERLFGCSPDTSPRIRRIVVAYCAQRVLEAATAHLMTGLVLSIPMVKSNLLILTGGSFYNVKLNRLVQRLTGMRTMPHPWAGDQGAAMGMAYGGVLQINDAFVGSRIPPKLMGLYSVSDKDWSNRVAVLVDAGHVVNVVRGAMEFGPRALCNTSTFALPTRDNVAKINNLNERDDAMPMAPVMTREAAGTLLNDQDLAGLAVGERYMISTCAFKRQPPDRLLGVVHRDPLYDVWTARPQVTDDPEVVRLLQNFPDEVLINTSFNYHGEPIVYSLDDAMKTHSMQCFRAQTTGAEQPKLVLVVPS